MRVKLYLISPNLQEAKTAWRTKSCIVIEESLIVIFIHESEFSFEKVEDEEEENTPVYT